MSSTAVAGTGMLHPNNTFLRAPNYVNANSVLASSQNALTFPVGCNYLRLSSNNSGFWVTWGNTGATTVATTNGGSAGTGVQSEFILQEVTRNIGSTVSTTAISVISTAATVISQSWWTPN